MCKEILPHSAEILEAEEEEEQEEEVKEEQQRGGGGVIMLVNFDGNNYDEDGGSDMLIGLDET